MRTAIANCECGLMEENAIQERGRSRKRNLKNSFSDRHAAMSSSFNDNETSAQPNCKKSKLSSDVMMTISSTSEESNSSVDSNSTSSVKHDGIPSEIVNVLRPWETKMEGEYEVGQIIGSGSFGIVYAGTRKCDNLPIAIKKYPEFIVNHWGQIDGKNVPLEFQLLKKVSENAGIVTMLDWLEVAGYYILIMERPVQSIDLYRYCERYGPLTEKTGRNIFTQIAKAVQHCHENGVIHRDIKARNVLVHPESWEAWLIDFGCGALLKDSPYTKHSGTVVNYPPEWFEKHHYFGESLDVWALGVLLYVMIEDRQPFKSIQEIIDCEVSFVRDDEISMSCKNLIRSILTKDVTQRPSVSRILRHQWFCE